MFKRKIKVSLSLFLTPFCLSQHVDGFPGGGCGPHRVAGADGDVSDREVAQTGDDVFLKVIVLKANQRLNNKS